MVESPTVHKSTVHFACLLCLQQDLSGLEELWDMKFDGLTTTGFVSSKHRSVPYLRFQPVPNAKDTKGKHSKEDAERAIKALARYLIARSDLDGIFPASGRG